jgi:hypothetical protein
LTGNSQWRIKIATSGKSPQSQGEQPNGGARAR